MFKRFPISFYLAFFVLILGILKGEFDEVRNLFHQNKLSKNITSKSAEYEGFVFKLDKANSEFSRYQIDLKQRIQPVPQLVSGRILLTIQGACVLNSGSRIQWRGSVKPPISFKSPGAFRFDKFLQHQNIWGTSFVQNCESVHLEQAIQNQSTILRQWKDWIDNDVLEFNDVLVSLMTGYRLLEKKSYETFKNAGISHLFVVSGTHFAIFIFLLFSLVKPIFRWLVPSDIFLFVERDRLMAVIGILVSIAIISIYDKQPPLFRAFIMVSVIFLGQILLRKSSALNTMSWAFILLVGPNLDRLYQTGFQLSYLCVALILFVVWPKVLMLTRSITIGIQKRICQFVFLNIGLQFLLIPYFLYQFGKISIAGFFHNLWAIPYFQFIVLPLVLLGQLIQYTFSSLPIWYLKVWNSVVQFCCFILARGVFSDLEFSFPWFSYRFVILILYGNIFLWKGLRAKWVYVSLVVIFSFWGFQFWNHHYRYDVQVSQIDVGQGDSLLLQTQDSTLLIDGGGSPFKDIGKEVLIPFLRYKWLKHVDVVVVTHDDYDHYGGLFSLLDSFSIGELWISRMPQRESSLHSLIEVAHQKEIPVYVKCADDHGFNKGRGIEVLWPKCSQMYLDDNDQSLVLQYSFGDRKFLFTGDISKSVEHQLIENSLQEPVEFLKVAHHGSKTSSSEKFLAKVRPKFMSIGVGQNSHFGHPHSIILDRLNRFGTYLYRTDLNGTYTLGFNETSLGFSFVATQ